MKKEISIYSIILLLIFVLTDCTDLPQPVITANKINNESLGSDQLKEDALFLSLYAHNLMYDNEMAEIALLRIQGDSLKNLVQSINQENDLLLDRIQQVAQQNAITLPTQLGKAAQEKIKDLEEIRPNIFDHEFMEWAVDQIDDELNELDELSQKKHTSESIIEMANIISSQKHVHKKELAKLHQSIGYHYD